MKPIEYFLDAWQRCGELKILHGYLSNQITAALSVNELLRAEWVARISAMDLFVHELVAQNMAEIFQGNRPMCAGFSKFQCSSETIMRIKNAHDPLDAASAFDLEVRTKLSYCTYQFPDDIASGFRFFSDKELWNEIALLRGAPAQAKTSVAKTIKKELSLIIVRRNKIAHEADLEPIVPRRPWSIERSDVDHVESVVEALVRDIDLLAK